MLIVDWWQDAMSSMICTLCELWLTVENEKGQEEFIGTLSYSVSYTHVYCMLQKGVGTYLTF